MAGLGAKGAALCLAQLIAAVLSGASLFAPDMHRQMIVMPGGIPLMLHITMSQVFISSTCRGAWGFEILEKLCHRIKTEFSGRSIYAARDISCAIILTGQACSEWSQLLLASQTLQWTMALVTGINIAALMILVSLTVGTTVKKPRRAGLRRFLMVLHMMAVFFSVLGFLTYVGLANNLSNTDLLMANFGFENQNTDRPPTMSTGIFAPILAVLVNCVSPFWSLWGLKQKIRSPPNPPVRLTPDEEHQWLEHRRRHEIDDAMKWLDCHEAAPSTMYGKPI